MTKTSVAIWKRFRDCESGASAVEYAVLAAFVGIGIVAGVVLLGNSVATQHNEVANEVVEVTEPAIRKFNE